MVNSAGPQFIGRWGLVVALSIGPVLGETFEERWPRPMAADPAPVVQSVKPKIEKKHKARKRGVFVCHKQYYLKRGYKHWRCKR
jgi:hypothetical protein